MSEDKEECIWQYIRFTLTQKDGCYITKEEALRFQAIPLEQICIDEDAVGNISEVHRKFHWTSSYVSQGTYPLPERSRTQRAYE